MYWVCMQVSRQSVGQDEVIKVKLTSDSQTPFKGFILKALEVGTEKIVGTFTIIDEENDATNVTEPTAQYLNCTHPQVRYTSKYTSNN